MGKIIGGIVIGLIVIIGIAVGVLYFNLDKVIIAAVEEYGSEVTKTDVVLNEVDLDLTSGKGALKIHPLSMRSIRPRITWIQSVIMSMPS